MATDHNELAQSVATKTGLDIALIIQLIAQYGPVFVALLKTLIEAWNDNPVFAATTTHDGECDPALKEALEAACKSACETCCKTHCALHIAGCCH